MYRLLLIVVAFVAFTACSSTPNPTLSKHEKEQMLGPNPDPALKWTKVTGADFTVYHGIPVDAKNSEIGFYIGHAPSFHPEPGSTLQRSHLADIPVTWHRKKHDDGSFYETALLEYGNNETLHVWIYASSAEELKQREAQLAALPWFTQTPPKSS